MSAYVVSREHIDAMVTGALALSTPAHRFSWYWNHNRHELHDSYDDGQSATRTGRMLWAENERSVAYRYEEGAAQAGAVGLADSYVFTQLPGADRSVPVLAALATLIRCYEYQTCESPDWRETEAHAFCSALKNAILHALPSPTGPAWDTDTRDVFLTARGINPARHVEPVSLMSLVRKRTHA